MAAVNDEKKSRTKELIYRTSITLFREHGFENVSVRQIIESVNIAKGTFFSYYPSKVDVLAHWYEGLILQSINQPDTHAGSLSDKLVTLSQTTFQNALADEGLWLAKTFYAQSNLAIQKAEIKSDRAFRDHVTKIIRQDQTPLSLISPEELADLVATLVTGSIREWIVSGRETDLNDTMASRLRQLVSLAH